MATSIDAVQSRPFMADRNRIDLTWERAQEQAMHAFEANKPAVARAQWAKALDIAEAAISNGAIRGLPPASAIMASPFCA